MPVALMPSWLKLANDWNPITFVIEAMRALMTVGFEWDVIGRAIVATGPRARKALGLVVSEPA